jgi:hypothetical protein
MKITMSRAVLAESDNVGYAVATSICKNLGTPMPTTWLGVDGQIDMAVENAASLKNFSVTCEGDNVVYEIDDKIVLAVLRMYGKGAGYVDTLLAVAKPLFRGLKDDLDDIGTLVTQRK